MLTVAYIQEIMQSFATSVAVFLGFISAAAILFHIFTASKSEFNPRSILYFLSIATLLFMYFYPPATELDDVIF